MDYYPAKRRKRRRVVWKASHFSLKLTQGNGEPRDLVEAVVVASSDAVAITSAEDDELFAKNFFKQKRILIISMIVPLPPPKKCLLSMTLLGILLNRKAKHLSNCIAFHYYFRGSGCDFSAENIDDDKWSVLLPMWLRRGQ